MPNPLDFLFYKPEPVKPTGPAKRRPLTQDEFAATNPGKVGPKQVLAQKALEGLAGVGRGLLTSDPNMPREEFDKTGWGEKAGMLLAAAPFGTTGIKGLYSRVNKAIEGFPGKQINANRALNTLRNQASGEEIGYRQLDSFLKGKEGKAVPTAEIKTFAEEHPLKLKVKTYGEPNPGSASMEDWFYRKYARRATESDLRNESVISDWEKDISNEPGRYDRYTLPGGQNYREQVIQLDKPVPQTPDERAKEIWAASGDEYPGWHSLTAEEQQNVLNDLKYFEMRDSNTYRSHHWPDPNPIAHVRFNERVLPNEEVPVPSDLLSDWTPDEYRMSKGNRGRFLEEVQSDWHEAGRDRGYETPEYLVNLARLETETSEAVKSWNQTGERIKAFLTERGYPQYSHYQTEALINPARYHAREFPEILPLLEEYKQGESRIFAANDAYNATRETGTVPDAPFKEDWPDLVLKQQLAEVAERPDLDWLGFTTGQTQIDRYDLSEVANRIRYDPQRGILEIYDRDMNHVGTHDVTKPEDLVPLIGKDAADRLLANEVNYQGATGEPENYFELAGEDLQIGGTGMTEFYDKQLPRKLEKILAPFGGKVERVPLTIPVDPRRPGYDNPHSAYSKPQTIEMWYAKLSPEMKAAIKEKGLPLLMALLAAEFGDDYMFEDNTDARIQN